MAIILVADDDALVRSTMQKLLLKAGHTVYEAANGIAAEQVIARAPIELLITDIVMPNKEGLMLVRDLKKRTPKLRIIAMSGGGNASGLTLLEAAAQFGADAILRKPFRGAELIDLVSATITGADTTQIRN